MKLNFSGRNKGMQPLRKCLYNKSFVFLHISVAAVYSTRWDARAAYSLINIQHKIHQMYSH